MSNDSVKIQAGEKTQSFKIDEMTLDELVQLSQGFGHQIEQIRQKRHYLKLKIDERLRMHERSGDPSREEGIKRRAAAEASGQAAVAPGVVLEVKSES